MHYLLYQKYSIIKFKFKNNKRYYSKLTIYQRRVFPEIIVPNFNSSIISTSQTKINTWLQSWLFDYEVTDINEQTLYRYWYFITEFIFPHFDGVYLSDLSPLCIKDFYDTLPVMSLDNPKQDTINLLANIHTMLFKSLNQALLFGLISKNPCSSARFKHIND